MGDLKELSYLSRTPGIGGTMKGSAEDFVVEEIMTDGRVLERDMPLELAGGEGDFTHFVLQKKNWNTLDALREIGRKLGCGIKCFGYAGTKDRKAITTQLASVYKRELKGISAKDIRILGSWRSDGKVSLGDLLGNRFTIKVKSGKRKTEGKVNGIYEEMGGHFPNYFGPQRFGIRGNTHLVGKHMLQGTFRKACNEYLFGGHEEKNEAARTARANLRESGDYSKALKEFPKHLAYERLILLHLSKNPNDFVNAIRKLPRGLSLMFVHAYQSYLFNRILSEKTARGGGADIGEYYCGENELGFPEIGRVSSMGFLVGKLVGYESETSELEREILEDEGIRREDFKMRQFPEIGSKGTHRIMYCPLKDFEFSEGDCRFRFTLPSGAYATVAMREFIDVEKGS